MNLYKKLLSFFLCYLLVLTFVLPGEQIQARKKIRLNKKNLTIIKGKKYRLKVKGTKKKVVWKSGKKKIATVSKTGVVKAKKIGRVNITAKVAGKKLVCRVKVKAKPVKRIHRRTCEGMWKTRPTPTPTPSPSPMTGAEDGNQNNSPSVPTPVSPDSIQPEPVFSKESGSYLDAFDLELSAPAGSTIYYTTDGSVPLYEEEKEKDDFPLRLATNRYTGAIRIKNRDNAANQLCSAENIPYMYDPTDYYNGPFYPKASDVPKATVIRAMAVDQEGNKSKVVTKVYFVAKDLQSIYKNASVISIVTDPVNLLSEKTGIYRYGNWENSGAEWERPAEVTYFEENGEIPFETTMGLRIHGNYTRRWGQKSLRLYFREELGMKNLKGYQLIPEAVNADGTPTKKYKRFILRNGGNEYAYSKMQDVFIQSMVKDRAFATQSARPCVLFLNGEYWGLYNLTERYSDHYLEEEFGVDKANVVCIKNGELDEGQEEDYALYEKLLDMADLDMSQQSNYEKFKEMVDIQSCLDYYATEIYIGNHDWPDNNVQLWRTRVAENSRYGDTKWRYMLYDTEYSMDLWGSDEGGTINRIDAAGEKDPIFAALCKNAEFRQDFADTLMDICHNNFEVTKAVTKLDAMAAVYRPLMAQYKKRFGNGDLDSRVEGMKSYIAGREIQLKEFIKNSLGIIVQ